jgi:hypothetical protein
LFHRDRISERGKRPVIVVSLFASIGTVSLVSSLLFTSTVLAFIGLGFTLWAAVLFYTRPQRYVRSGLVDSTGLSLIQAIDRVMGSLGYTEKGVYLPSGNGQTTVFVPSQPLTRIPEARSIEKKTFVDNPNGMVIPPPGLALANLIERQLGVGFKQLSLKKLSSRLPKLLIEDLEIAQDFEMHVEGNIVRFKFVESVYSELCNELQRSTRVCSSLGCPISSAMACIVAEASGKPIAFEEDIPSENGRTMVSSCRILGA